VVVGEEVKGEGVELGLRQELHTENLSKHLETFSLVRFRCSRCIPRYRT
jgi:hypothetical protein